MIGVKTLTTQASADVSGCIGNFLPRVRLAGRWNRHPVRVGSNEQTNRDFAVVVGPGSSDGGPDSPLERARLFDISVSQIVQYRIVHLQGPLSDDQLSSLVAALLTKPLGQWWMHREDHLPPGAQGHAAVFETGLRPGVTDREAAELVQAARLLGYPVENASIGSRWFVYGRLRKSHRERLIRHVLHNEVIERWAEGALAPAYVDHGAESPGVAAFDLSKFETDDLVQLSKGRRLGMSLDEMEAVQKHFVGLNKPITDGELETIAQTWSEHCSHKTFGALISTPEGEIDGLLKTYLRAATDAIAAPWVHSAFVDNAGIVAFDDGLDLAVKAETHNHPSALEPFGGANTGVGGVVRDILGVSAKPIAVTDILCFGPESLPSDELPAGVLHPTQIRSGVIAGVADYGNKIGVPNLAGAIFHDSSYTTTPLVFAGCVGVLPTGSNPTRAQVGDAVVVLGGRVGRDGVGGATFSSQTMSTSTADVAGSSVQIGDPVVEKGLIDVIVAARDAGLYNAITDCGAGGLSSAVGEMGAELGVEVQLDLVPRKYPGLAPWEVWLSEAQERMVVATDQPDALLTLAEKWQVEATVIGRMTGDRRLRVAAGEISVVDLDCEFLHNGRPRLHLRAEPNRTPRPARPDVEAVGSQVSASEALFRLLAHPSLRSNEDVVRLFDHEVLGATVVRPYGGPNLDGPADGTVFVPAGVASVASAPDPVRGAVVGIGAAVLLGRHDTYAMAWAAVDEAIRNAVVAGADPDRIALLDNFAWGDPTEPGALADLVDACRGCHDAAVNHGSPYVSGKDSLYNEFATPDGERDPVTPTLIITALGITPDTSLIPATGLVEAGNDIWLVGSTDGELGGSYVDEIIGGDAGGAVPPPDAAAADRHRQMHEAIMAGLVVSAHDIGDGGAAVAAAEMSFAGRLGVTLSLATDHGPRELFGEGAGRYFVEVKRIDGDQFEALVPSSQRVGWVTEDDRVRVGPELDVSLAEVERAYRGHVPGYQSDDRAAPSNPTGSSTGNPTGDSTGEGP